FLDRLAPDNPFYNLPGAFQVTGDLDVAALRRTFREIVRRHESLRTTFPEVDGRPVQEVSPVPGFLLPVIDLEGAAPAERLRAEAARLSAEEARRPFDLARGLLFRVCLVRLDRREHTLLVNSHHIVSDGWSMGVLFDELATLYSVFSRGEPSPLPELPIQYADFAVWQRGWMQGEQLAAQLDFWRRQLASIPESLELPADHPRPAVESFRGAMLPFALPEVLVLGRKALTRRGAATPSMIMLAGYSLLLGRLAGREDLAVGVAIANRTR